MKRYVYSVHLSFKQDSITMAKDFFEKVLDDLRERHGVNVGGHLVDIVPLPCRNFDPWNVTEDKYGDPVDPKSCTVCGFKEVEHQ